MKFEKDEKFLMRRREKIFEDSLCYSGGTVDRRIVKAVKGLLSPEEQESADFSAAVVTGEKLVLFCERPEELQEVIFVKRRDPGKVYRRRLRLKRKKNTGKT